MNKVYAIITGIASYVPKQVLTNQDLEKLVDTSDEWIVSRTGMKERRVAAKDEGSSSMGFSAAQKLLEKLEILPDSIDLIMVATMTPDYLTPSNAALIQGKLAATKAAAFDFQAACSGFVYGLSIAKAFIESKMYRRILFIATEKMTSFIDYSDRNTCILFGDGAAALLIEPEGEGLLIDSVSLGADGSQKEIAWIPSGGAISPATHATVDKKEHFFRMMGKELFKHAVRCMVETSKNCLEESKITEHHLTWIVPHQANERILDAVGKKFPDPSIVFKAIKEFGNTSAASIPLALDRLLDEHPLKKDQKILVTAFGAGLTWGSAVLVQT